MVQIVDPRSAAERARRRGRAGGDDAAPVDVQVEGRTIQLPRLDRVIYPRTGFTKAEAIEYYAAVAEAILPHLRRRPLTLKRYRGTVEGLHFYEKRCPPGRPDWVATVEVWSEAKREHVPFCSVDDAATLVWLVGIDTLELHPALSRAEDLERPTSVVFDLDPGAPAGLLDAARVALDVRDMLDGIGLRTLAKTSGGAGIQVFVPLNTPVTYATTKRFARTVAATLARVDSQRVTATMSKDARRARVFVDWSQNDLHKSTVSAYSLRAGERPLVSAPVEWKEVKRAIAAGDEDRLRFSPEQARQRLDQRGDPFETVVALQQHLPAVA